MLYKIKCKICKKEFYTNNKSKVYCSNECRKEGYYLTIKKAVYKWRKNSNKYRNYMRVYMQNYNKLKRKNSNSFLGTFYLMNIKGEDKDFKQELKYIKKLKKLTLNKF